MLAAPCLQRRLRADRCRVDPPQIRHHGNRRRTLNWNLLTIPAYDTEFSLASSGIEDASTETLKINGLWLATDRDAARLVALELQERGGRRHSSRITTVLSTFPGTGSKPSLRRSIETQYYYRAKGAAAALTGSGDELLARCSVACTAVGAA